MKEPHKGGQKETRVVSVSRALALLDAFQPSEIMLTLGELARRTRLHKTTALRLARTMAAARYLDLLHAMFPMTGDKVCMRQL